MEVSDKIMRFSVRRRFRIFGGEKKEKVCDSSGWRNFLVTFFLGYVFSPTRVAGKPLFTADARDYRTLNIDT